MCLLIRMFYGFYALCNSNNDTVGRNPTVDKKATERKYLDVNTLFFLTKQRKSKRYSQINCQREKKTCFDKTSSNDAKSI